VSDKSIGVQPVPLSAFDAFVADQQKPISRPEAIASSRIEIEAARSRARSGETRLFGGRVDNEAIRRTRRRIKEWFPYHQDAKDAVAHTAELSTTDEAFEKNRPTTGAFLVDGMTADGMVLSKHCTAGPEKGAQNIILRADQATLDQLLEIRRMVHEAFSSVRVQWSGGDK
jgi:hypothetical protein